MKDSGIIKYIAFYLPQFHPIPENDKWWGKGFTEWTNVAKAKPRFDGHYQPHIPADLGFYDLRLKEVQIEQAELAKKYGIYGFCYYHYWFNGKLLLEKPLQNMINNSEPEFPFCLCWANENWTRAWDGNENDILIKQDYSFEDDLSHIRYLSNIFEDKRYIRISGKPLIIIYRASRLPDPRKTTQIWRDEARKLGLGELFICKVESFSSERSNPFTLGFDASIEFQPDWMNLGKIKYESINGNKVYDYNDFVNVMLEKEVVNYPLFRCVTPSWDNSARKNNNATILHNSNEVFFQNWLRSMSNFTINNHFLEDKLLFINAWNEWAEGNHLEPDLKNDHLYLKAVKKVYDEVNSPQIIKHNDLISIIIPVYNKVNLTKQCIESIYKNTSYPNYELIIVNNASTDNTLIYLETLNSKIKIITNKTNLGFAKACNQGASISKGKYLVFLNNDTIPLGGWLTELVSSIKSNQNVGIVGCKLFYPDESIQHCGASMRYDYGFFRHQYKFLSRHHPLVSKQRELDAVTAACFITPKELFFNVGGFDENYLNGCEDMDYCVSVRQNGFKILYNPNSELYHFESQTPRTYDKDKDNFEYFIKKWGYDKIQNEIEIYEQDGFWTKVQNDFFENVKNNYLADWLKEIECFEKSNLHESANKINLILSRIYPSKAWKKRSLEVNKNVHYSIENKLSNENSTIILYCLRDLHLPVLLPVYQKLIEVVGQDVRFMLPVDLKEVQITKLHLDKNYIPYLIHTPPKDKYSCIVTADVFNHLIDGWGPVVCIGHGTISKGIYFTDKNITRRENFARVLCVPGPYYAESYGNQVFSNIEVTGFSKMDSFVNSQIDRFVFLRNINFHPAKKTILYAPTFNPELSSLEIFKDLITQIDRSKYQIIIKLHNATEDNFKKIFKNIASANDNIYFVDELEIAPFMFTCDCLISDVSSVFIEFLFFNKPILLYNSTKLKDFYAYNFDNIEFKFRDSAYQFTNKNELLNILEQINHEDTLSEKRVKYFQKLFGKIDGKSAERISKVIFDVVKNKVEVKVPENTILPAIYLLNEIINPDIARNNIKNALYDLEIYTHNKEWQNHLPDLNIIILDKEQYITSPFVCMNGSYELSKEWDYHWIVTNHFNKKSGVFGPVLFESKENKLQQLDSIYPQLNKPKSLELAHYYRSYFKYNGEFWESITVERINSDCMFIVGNIEDRFISKYLQSKQLKNDIEILRNEIQAQNLHFGVYKGIIALSNNYNTTNNVNKEETNLQITNNLTKLSEKKLKVLFVCHDFPPYKFAGAQLYAFYLAKELIKKGHHIDILHPVDVNSRKDNNSTSLYDVVRTDYEGLRVFQINITDNHKNYINEFYNPDVEREFQNIVVKERYDIVHYHLLHRLSSTLPYITKSLSIKTVATLHDYWLMCIRGHMVDSNHNECNGPESYEKCSICNFNSVTNQGTNFFKSRLDTTLKGYQAIDYILSPSEFLANTHQKYGFKKPEVLPLGWLELPMQNRNLEQGKIIFGYTGQIISRKGLDILLTALWKTRLTNWELKIYGEIYEPNYYEQIRHLIEKHPNIRYFGAYETNELSIILNQFDVFVMPSRRENYPLTLMEALSAKIPAIASNVGGVKEMMINGVDGFIFNNMDVENLQELLEKFMDYPGLVTNIKSNIKPIKTLRENADEIEIIYSKLIDLGMQ